MWTFVFSDIGVLKQEVAAQARVGSCFIVASFTFVVTLLLLMLPPDVDVKEWLGPPNIVAF